GGGVVCPSSIDTVLVIDRGSQVSTAAFSDAKTSLNMFVDALHPSIDQVGLVSFESSAELDKQLTVSGDDVKEALAILAPGQASFIGAGIEAARQELSGPRHKPGAEQLIIVLSDGSDAAAPSSGATLAMANIAKAAGIRIISVQYGSTATTV